MLGEASRWIETACDVLFANGVAKAPPIRPVPITTIFFTLLLLGPYDKTFGIFD
jgi:hypothetical protein